MEVRITLTLLLSCQTEKDVELMCRETPTAIVQNTMYKSRNHTHIHTHSLLTRAEDWYWPYLTCQWCLELVRLVHGLLGRTQI